LASCHFHENLLQRPGPGAAGTSALTGTQARIIALKTLAWPPLHGQVVRRLGRLEEIFALQTILLF
jgi:hypothetical protein